MPNLYQRSSSSPAFCSLALFDTVPGTLRYTGVLCHADPQIIHLVSRHFPDECHRVFLSCISISAAGHWTMSVSLRGYSQISTVPLHCWQGDGWLEELFWSKATTTISKMWANSKQANKQKQWDLNLQPWLARIVTQNRNGNFSFPGWCS